MPSAHPGRHILVLWDFSILANLQADIKDQRVKNQHSHMNSGNSENTTNYVCINYHLWPNQQ